MNPTIVKATSGPNPKLSALSSARPNATPNAQSNAPRHTPPNRLPYVRTGLLALLFVSALGASQAQAQLLNKVKNATLDRAGDRIEKNIMDRVERKVSQKMEKSIDDSFTRLFGPVGGDGDQMSGGGQGVGGSAAGGGGMSAAGGTGGTGAGNGMGGGSRFLPAGNVKTEDVYTFDFTSRFELRTVSSGTGGSRNTGGSSGESSLLEFEFLYNSSEPYAATVLAWSDTGEPESNSTIIFDRKNAAMVMLMEQDGEKASASFEMDTSLSDLDRMEAEKNAADLEATGRMPASDADGSSDASVQDIGSFGYLYGGYDALGKKKILSFDAEGYRYSSTGYDVEVWISPEPAEGFAKRFSMSRSMQAFSMLPLFDSGNGIVVEMSMSLQNGGVTERISYRMTEFNPRARRVFRMSEYPTAGTE